MILQEDNERKKKINCKHEAIRCGVLGSVPKQTFNVNSGANTSNCYLKRYETSKGLGMEVFFDMNFANVKSQNRNQIDTKDKEFTNNENFTTVGVHENIQNKKVNGLCTKSNEQNDQHADLYMVTNVKSGMATGQTMIKRNEKAEKEEHASITDKRFSNDAPDELKLGGEWEHDPGDLIKIDTSTEKNNNVDEGTSINFYERGTDTTRNHSLATIPIEPHYNVNDQTNDASIFSQKSNRCNGDTKKATSVTCDENKNDSGNSCDNFYKHKSIYNQKLERMPETEHKMSDCFEFFSSPIKNRQIKRRLSVNEAFENEKSKRLRLTMQKKRLELNIFTRKNSDDLFIENFAGMSQKRKTKAKSRLAFSEGEIHKIENVRYFSNKSFGVNAQMIKERFKSKNVEKEFENQAITYLKSFIIKTPSINKIRTGPELYPVDDPVINFESKDTKMIFDLIDLFLAKKTNGNIDFLEYFTEKEVSILVQQLNNDVANTSKRIQNLIEALFNAADVYDGIIKATVSNEIILYIEEKRHHKGIPELLGLVHLLLVKNVYTDEEILELLDFCLLPTLKTKVIEVVQEEVVKKIFLVITKIEQAMIVQMFYYFSRHFKSSWTKAKISILRLMHEILKQNVDLDFCLIAPYFCRICNLVFTSENHCLIECLFSFFVDSEISETLAKNIHLITPNIFDALFLLSKRYWNVKGKSNVYVILQRVMNYDISLFNTCLSEHNKTQEKIEIESNLNDEMTKHLFESCLDNFDAEEIMKMRKKSLLPFETDAFEI